MGHLLTSLGQLRLKEMCLLQECAITEFYWLHWVRAAPIRIEEMDDPLRHIQLPGFTELFFLRAQGIRFVGVESRFILGFVFFFSLCIRSNLLKTMIATSLLRSPS